MARIILITILIVSFSIVFSCSFKKEKTPREIHNQLQNTENYLHELLKSENYEGLYSLTSTELKDCFPKDELLVRFQKAVVKLKAKDANFNFEPIIFKNSGWEENPFLYRVGKETEYADESGNWIFEKEKPKLKSYAVISSDKTSNEQAKDFIQCNKNQ